MHWRLKGLLQKVIGYFPGGKGVNDHLQQRFGGLRDFDKNIAGKVDDWKHSMGYLRECDFSPVGATLLEIGTGWYPTFPICFSLSGATRIVTYDIVKQTDTRLTLRMIAALESHLPAIADAAGIGIDDIRDKYGVLRKAGSLESLLKIAGVELRSPADASATGLVPASVDLVYSNSVMEHVPENVIRALMRESARVLRPGGLVLHNVACNDHYAHIDPTISFVNYLQYNERQWRRWNNSFLYQNRLRAPQFLNLAAQAGLEVVHKSTAVRSGTREALAKLQVAPEFRRYSTDELALTTVDFVAMKRA